MLRPSQVGDDAAHHVVARGRHGDALASPGRARPRAARRRRSGSAPGRSPVMSRNTAGAPVSASSRWIARATASRGCSSSTKRSPAASCSVAPSPRTASRDQEALAPGIADDRRRVELDELEVGQLGAGGAREQQARAVGARRVGGARPQRRRAARGEQHGARGERAPVVARDARRRGRRRLQQRADAPALEHRDPLVLHHVGGQLAQDPPPGGAAAGVHDAADAVAALQPEREAAVAVGVEADAERLEVGEARGRLLAQHLGGRAAHEPAAGGERVLEVLRRASRPRASAAASPPCAQ